MNNKRIFALSLLGLFAFVLALNLVSAADPADLTSSFFSWESWKAGTGLDNTVAKILLMSLVFMAVYAIFEKIPIFGNRGKFIKFPFSLIVAYLAMAYLTPGEVINIMKSYSSMGFAISAIIPFIIMVVFSFTLATSSVDDSWTQKLANKALAFLMWLFFFGFLVYKVWVGLELNLSIIGYASLAFIVLMILVGFGFMWRKIQKLATKEELKSASDTTAKAIKAIRLRAAETQALSKGAKKDEQAMDEDDPYNSRRD